MVLHLAVNFVWRLEWLGRDEVQVILFDVHLSGGGEVEMSGSVLACLQGGGDCGD